MLVGRGPGGAAGGKDRDVELPMGAPRASARLCAENRQERARGGGVRTDGTLNLYHSTRNDGNERGARDGTGGVSNLAFNLAEGVSLFAPIHARSAKLSTGMPLHLGAQPGPRTINQREQR